MKNEYKEGTAKEEAVESPAEEKKEQKAGKGDAGDGVTVPEEFQKQVHHVMKAATTKHHIRHVRDRVSAREDEMMKEEQKTEKGSSAKVPTIYDESGMP